METDPDKVFRGGLIFGPSGCGKSSFLKAGLLPIVESNVSVVYVESTRSYDFGRIIRGLRRHCPWLSPDVDLVQALSQIRQNKTAQKKILIVLDQFEQWLNARNLHEGGELIRAIRQCDGLQLQFIAVVRDDFWLPATQFMRELDIELVPGNNVSTLELFNLRHARKVLMNLGQTYGAIPLVTEEISTENEQFLDASVSELAQNDYVIPVQLALFFEMVKDKPWIPKTLKEFGGFSGIGVRFLEETFSSRSTVHIHRFQSEPARAVLAQLIHGSDAIKGAMRSESELLAASGLEKDQPALDRLLNTLDVDLRLITSTAPENLETANSAQSSSLPKRERYFHLTHDYLVPALREWLTRKQRETKRGRAELRLTERLVAWKARPERQSLLTLFEWINVLLFTSKRFRLDSQDKRKLLSASTRFHSLSLLFVLVMLLGLGFVVKNQIDSSRAETLVESLTNASTSDVPQIIHQLEPVRPYATPRLKHALSVHLSGTVARRNIAMSLLDQDKTLLDELIDALLEASGKDFSAIRDVVGAAIDRKELVSLLWKRHSDDSTNPHRRWRCLVALAEWDPPTSLQDQEMWASRSQFLAHQLISELRRDPASFPIWVEATKPISKVLQEDLNRVFVNERDPADQLIAANVLSEFLAEQARDLVELILDSNPHQHSVIAEQLSRDRDAALETLRAKFESPATMNIEALSLEDRLKATRRRAHAAVTLFHFGETKQILECFVETPVPDLATYTEDRLGRLIVHPERLLEILHDANAAVRSAIFRSIGGMDPSKIAPETKEKIQTAAIKYYETDPDPGVHYAADWLLTSFGVTHEHPKTTPTMTGDRGWSVSPLGMKMVHFRGPIVSKMGSEPTEPNRDSDEDEVTQHIQRDFAIGATEVSLTQFLKFNEEFQHRFNPNYFPSRDCPMTAAPWYYGAQYCNWLSEQEGLPKEEWCFTEKGKVFYPVTDYLRRTGYRLPTEAEWEYVCRCESTTSFFWGNDPGMHDRYSWTLANTEGYTRPVGSKCPNRFGVFDILGNISEWTMEPHRKNMLDKQEYQYRKYSNDELEIFDSEWTNDSFYEDSLMVQR
ncbi:MAG: hypothetical protein FJ267_01720, partial [Planctomycetes bacterium]|nr:hypothetical protein [Planctomycetota bacterium]